MTDKVVLAGEEIPGKAKEDIAGLRRDPKSHDIG